VVTTNAFLTHGLYCPGSQGVIVSNNGITIDLKGFTLRGDRTPGAQGIIDVGFGGFGFDGLTVKNGFIRNFDRGVSAAKGADNVSVSDLVVSGNAEEGILVFGLSASVKSSSAYGNGGIGIGLVGTGAKVESSTASGNGSAGIFAEGSTATVSSSSSWGNKSEGINLDALAGEVVGSNASGNFTGIEDDVADSVSVISSNASGNTANGIEIVAATTGKIGRVLSSTASGNGGTGIFVLGEEAVVISKNRANGNGFMGGASDLMGTGIHTSEFTVPPVGRNVARGNDDPGECIPASLC